jgi:hypothetical protein
VWAQGTVPIPEKSVTLGAENKKSSLSPADSLLKNQKIFSIMYSDEEIANIDRALDSYKNNEVFVVKGGDSTRYRNSWIVSWKELYEKKLKEQDEEWERCWSKAGKLAGLAAFSNTSPKDNLPNVLLREVRRDGGLAFELTVQQAAELAAG